jgi:hypothetical protein
MPASASGGGPLSPQAAAALQEGIGLIFGRWTALQMAVENEWGGRDSRAKADQLAASILSWFTNSRGTVCTPPSLQRPREIASFITEVAHSASRRGSIRIVLAWSCANFCTTEFHQLQNINICVVFVQDKNQFRYDIIEPC